MDREKILEIIKTIMTDIFNNENLTIVRETKMEDIEEWDSMSHLSLFMVLEEKFGKKFSADEITNTQSVNAIIDLIEKK